LRIAFGRRFHGVRGPFCCSFLTSDKIV